MASDASATSNRPVCAICIEKILPEANISKLNCNHEYHRDCLQPWLDANHDTCPLDRRRITSINGIATEQSEEKESSARVIEIQNPLREARTLYRHHISTIIGTIHNPSIHSADPLERQAAMVQLIASSIFRP